MKLLYFIKFKFIKYTYIYLIILLNYIIYLLYIDINNIFI